jgi:hypothetical protein
MRGQLVNGIRVRVDGKFIEERRPPTLVESQIAAQQPLDDDPDLADDPIS